MHVLVLAEGYFDHIKEWVRRWEQKRYQVGNVQAQVRFREIRLFDINIRADFQDQFLADLKAFMVYEPYQQLHGVSFAKAKELLTPLIEAFGGRDMGELHIDKYPASDIKNFTNDLIVVCKPLCYIPDKIDVSGKEWI